MASGTTALKTSCLCTRSTFIFNVPTSILPLPAQLCHCNISRRISGTICTSYVAIPLDCHPTPVDWKKALTPYHSSDILTRWFCTACGTHMFLEYAKDGQLWASTGTVRKDGMGVAEGETKESTDGLVRFMGNMWIEDTLDGGASEFVRKVGDRDMQRWLVAANDSEQIPLGWKDDSAQTASEDDTLLLRCHCNGVQLRVTRPNEQSTQAMSPFSDLIVPAPSGQSPANPKNQPWWLAPDRKRYLTGTCSCRSCRLATGFDIMSWSFVPLCNLTFTDGSPVQGTKEGLDSDPRIREMTKIADYQSPLTNKTIKRHFCPKCGATVFWWSDFRPGLIDVAVGLADSKSGVLAEEWFMWFTQRVSYGEEALNRELIDGLAEGLKDWAHEKKPKAS